jgi:Fic/DOC family N-terminal
MDKRLMSRLSMADRAIGELAGVGRTLPNPEILTAPIIRREAVLSSRIEGTRASRSPTAAGLLPRPARDLGRYGRSPAAPGSGLRAPRIPAARTVVPRPFVPRLAGPHLADPADEAWRGPVEHGTGAVADGRSHPAGDRLAGGPSQPEEGLPPADRAVPETAARRARDALGAAAQVFVCGVRMAAAAGGGLRGHQVDLTGHSTLYM